MSNALKVIGGISLGLLFILAIVFKILNVIGWILCLLIIFMVIVCSLIWGGYLIWQNYLNTKEEKRDKKVLALSATQATEYVEKYARDQDFIIFRETPTKKQTAIINGKPIFIYQNHDMIDGIEHVYIFRLDDVNKMNYTNNKHSKIDEKKIRGMMEDLADKPLYEDTTTNVTTDLTGGITTSVTEKKTPLPRDLVELKDSIEKQAQKEEA